MKKNSKTKRWIHCSLLALLAVGITGCSEGAAKKSEAPSENVSVQAVKEDKKQDQAAEKGSEDHTQFTLKAEVTDLGEYVYQAILEFDGLFPDPDSITSGTFEVTASGQSDKYHDSNVASTGDFKDTVRTVTKVEVLGNKVILTLLENEEGASTLSYIGEPVNRNVPLQLDYKIRQKESFSARAVSGSKQEISQNDKNYQWDQLVHNTETSKFISVKDKINYQLYIPKEGKEKAPLIVWFHGNGEADWNESGNNIVQMMGNKGAVAWTSDEAKQYFGDAYVMAFQAPDTWYHAQANKDNNYLDLVTEEMRSLIKQCNIDESRLYLAGCSAGGYMSTRLLIQNPDVFASACIIAPALDVATKRGGATPSDEELLKLKDSSTKIWLVQADNDQTVKTAECGDRIYGLIGSGEEVVTRFANSTTYEKDNIRYTKYDTVLDEKGEPKLVLEEDFNKDGVSESVKCSAHWSWIHALNNEPKLSDGTTLFDWMSKQAGQKNP